MRNFEKEMEKWKEEFEEKIKKEKETEFIEWVWKDNRGKKYVGKYQGEKKGEVPEGIGIFQPAKNRWTIWGEWKDGLLNGKIMRLEGMETVGSMNAKQVKSMGTTSDLSMMEVDMKKSARKEYAME